MSVFGICIYENTYGTFSSNAAKTKLADVPNLILLIPLKTHLDLKRRSIRQHSQSLKLSLPSPATCGDSLLNCFFPDLKQKKPSALIPPDIISSSSSLSPRPRRGQRDAPPCLLRPGHFGLWTILTIICIGFNFWEKNSRFTSSLRGTECRAASL